MDDFLSEARQRMLKAVEVLKNDLATIRTGRASPTLIENVEVWVYGRTQKLKLMELATISALDPKVLVLTPFDPSIVTEIQKGIQEVNLGLTPVVDGEIIRITIPSLTEERRQEFIKLARTKLEGGRIMIRQVRHEVMNHLKRQLEEKEINEDEHERQFKELQKITDKMIAEIDLLGEKKEEELKQI